MAMIGKIRNMQTLLMVVLGIGMLGFLVPFDAVIALMGTGGNQEVGSVNGESISAVEYQQAVQNRKQLGFTGEGLANEVWNDLVSELVMSDEYSDLGIEVTNKEFQELLFGDIDSGYMSRAFYSNGENKEVWVNRFRDMLLTDAGKASFVRYKKIILEKRTREKFDAITRVGAYANSLEGKYEYLATERIAEFKYVVKLFRNIQDSTVNVSDRDVQSYYADHKSEKQYEQKEGRDITLIKIPLIATQDDIDDLNAKLEAIKADWENIEDKKSYAEEEETGSVVSLRAKQVEESVEERSFFDVEVGTTVGPYKKGNVLILANVIGRTMVPDTAAKARHILLKAKDVSDVSEMAALNATADSLKRVLNNGGDFADLATRFSEDPGSKSNGGLLDFFQQGKMVPEFNDFCFDKRVGSIGAVETSYGVHLIEVLDRRYTEEEVEIAAVVFQIAPSDETKREAYNAANDFAIESSNKEQLISSAEIEGFTSSEVLNIIREAITISGLSDASELVRWVYGAKVGEISHPIIADNSYIVAVLDLAKEDGEPLFEAVENEMREGAIKEAKGRFYTELMSAGNLEDIATAIGETVRTGFKVNTKTSAISGSGAGAEPTVAGLGFSIPIGEISNPVVGTHGVWVIAPVSVTEPEDKIDFLDEQTTVVARNRSGVSQLGFPQVVVSGMLEASDVEDNRN
jgi:peptidyl-prolyl cis-trans isomerase D